MYFPPYKQLLDVCKRKAKVAAKEPQITIPQKLFDFLLQVAIASSDFDETRYLQENPDVRKALWKSPDLDAKQHFVGYGYFEGRPGALPLVDESWYLGAYPDVAAAVKSGTVPSASAHFEMIGAIEGRAPSKDYTEVASHWKSFLA